MNQVIEFQWPFYLVEFDERLAMTSIKKLAEEIIELQKTFSTDTTNVAILGQIATRYSQMGNGEGAIKYLEKVLQIESNNKDALSLLSKIEISQPDEKH